MTGSGTQQDPYILTTWEDLIADKSGYCEWHGNDLDFNNIQPNGLTSLVTIYGTIDFRDATFKNFYSRREGSGGALLFRHDISNLNFVNAYFQTSTSPLIQVGTGYTTDYVANNCRFSAIIATESETNILGSVASSQYYNNTTYRRCAFNFEAVSTATIRLASSNASFIDCTIGTDVTQGGNEIADMYSSSDYAGRFDNCKFTGRYLNRSGYVKVGTTQSRHKNNFYGFNEGTYLFASGGGVSIYNSDNVTAYEGSSNAVGCTTAQLGNAEYLRSVGFPIGVN